MPDVHQVPERLLLIGVPAIHALLPRSSVTVGWGAGATFRRFWRRSLKHRRYPSRWPSTRYGAPGRGHVRRRVRSPRRNARRPRGTRAVVSSSRTTQQRLNRSLRCSSQRERRRPGKPRMPSQCQVTLTPPLEVCVELGAPGARDAPAPGPTRSVRCRPRRSFSTRRWRAPHGVRPRAVCVPARFVAADLVLADRRPRTPRVQLRSVWEAPSAM